MRRSLRLSSLRELPATAAVLSIQELHDEILDKLTLSDLIHYRGASKEATADFHDVLGRRVRHYTRLFFPSTDNWDVFFIQLGIRESWIVGSIALAVVSMPSAPLPPSNLNVIAPYMWYEYWLKLMKSSFAFKVDADTDCLGMFSGVGFKYVRFSHPDVPDKFITITFARAAHVYELFVCGGNTNQVHAITAKEVVCTDIKGASEGTAVRGWWHQIKEQDMLWSPPASGMQYKSPFPADVDLDPSTAKWTRDCGWACPGRPRFTTGLQGIGHWPWGGHDGSGGLCSSVRHFGRSRLKWKTGDHCDNAKCSVNIQESDVIQSHHQE